MSCFGKGCLGSSVYDPQHQTPQPQQYPMPFETLDTIFGEINGNQL